VLSKCDQPNIFLTSKFFFTYFVSEDTPAHKTETDTAYTWETTNSKLSLQQASPVVLTMWPWKKKIFLTSKFFFITYLFFVQPHYP
jgi:hypothetical protein